MAMPAHDTFADASARAPHERTVETDGVDWHVLEAGGGPPLLLLHGTGSSTHSWRGLLPMLAERFRVIAPDLPGHGRSVLRDERALSIDGMSTALAQMLRRLDVSPRIVVGHSAGAALAARALLDKRMEAEVLVAINGAFVPFGGPAGQLFSPIARVFAASGWLSHWIARYVVSPESVERLLASTGSVIDDEYLDGYRRLFQSPAHVSATLGMMARWDLWSLQRDLPRLPARLVLIVGRGDRTVPPVQAEKVARDVPGAHVVALEGLGHLAHEEDPLAVASCIFEQTDADAARPR